MTNPDPVLDLLQRFQQEGVEYVLVGGQAVRLNGFCEHGSFIGRTTPGTPSLCNATVFKFEQ